MQDIGLLYFLLLIICLSVSFSKQDGDVHCATPQAVADGYVQFSKLTPGSKVKYICSDGLTLIGNASAICLDDGRWSVATPVCRMQADHEAARCATPVGIANGHSKFTGVTVGSVVEFVCSEGFTLIGDATAICLEDGRWTAAAPICRMNQPIDCDALKRTNPSLPSGLYSITPTFRNGKPIQVYCEMEKFGGGWTVIQRRIDGSVDFYRDWISYKTGFGDVSGNFWLGNDNINGMTMQNNGAYSLLVDMTRNNGESGFAFYSTFGIGDEASGYKLNEAGYCGTFGDSFINQNGMKFTTYDRDNDVLDSNCAQKFVGAWWYRSCHMSNLNGLYGSTEYGKGINWYTATDYYESLKTATMMIRPSSSSLAAPCK